MDTETQTEADVFKFIQKSSLFDALLHCVTLLMFYTTPPKSGSVTLNIASLQLRPDAFYYSLPLVLKLMKRGQGKHATGNYTSLFISGTPMPLAVITRYFAVWIQSVARPASVSSANA